VLEEEKMYMKSLKCFVTPAPYCTQYICVLLFQCVAWIGASALASVPAKLSLAELRAFPHQSNQHYEVEVGNTVSIHCGTPYSNPPAFLQYYRNKEKLQGKELYLQTS
jgi:hypothetical protein